MNPRIRLLAEQSGYGSRWTTTEQFEQFMEQFALLTVRECVGIVENLPAGYQDYRSQIEDAFRNDCVVKLREHFGIEP